jgi:bifunctional DNA-binding transcriptional regulator/antitoxin component of YhaV-PrlF toxin-antitoxin module
MSQEVTFTKKARVVGGNTIVTIPKEIVEAMDIDAGELIQVTIKPLIKPKPKE